MAVYEKRGYIKEYDENGNLISKVRKQPAEPAPQPAVEEFNFDDGEE